MLHSGSLKPSSPFIFTLASILVLRNIYRVRIRILYLNIHRLQCGLTWYLDRIGNTSQSFPSSEPYVHLSMHTAQALDDYKSKTYT